MLKQKLTKYNPCWCGSRRFYKDCHMNMDAASPADRVAASHVQYLNDWSTNSTHFDKQKLYDWMAPKLKDSSPKQILDIGCGTGEGLSALMRTYDCKIVALDENKAVIRVAQQRMSDEGREVELCERLHHLTLGQKSHQIDIQLGQLRAEKKITLIEADWLSKDDELFQFIEGLPKFDAVTMWLTGAHRVRIESANITALRLQTEAQYRLHMQNRAYEVADKILRPRPAMRLRAGVTGPIVEIAVPKVRRHHPIG